MSSPSAEGIAAAAMSLALHMNPDYVNRRAALVVAGRATDREDARRLLTALGYDTTEPDPAPAVDSRHRTAAERKAERDRARQRARDFPELIPHGTQTGYDRWGCRCLRCADVRSARDSDRRAVAR